MTPRAALRTAAWATTLVLLSTTSHAASGATPADLQRGAAIYERCVACHAFEYDRTGPRHCGLFGRRAGTVPGFQYSAAMRESNIVWNEKTLDVFLKSPMTAVPGTSMGYAGIADAGEREALIGYLKKEGKAARCRK
ncbi:c-type cytochrome [Imbroritus primus]|uniref:c-type cytochrome n=1 Tax=Imbroritus primus TaxID=3058603 RepID=UPI003D16214E